MIGISLRDVSKLGSGLELEVFDDFQRSNSNSLGETPVGKRQWRVGWDQDLPISSAPRWSIVNNAPFLDYTAPNSQFIKDFTDRPQYLYRNSICYIEGYYPDMNISLDVSDRGHDGILFRYKDFFNYWYLASYYKSVRRTRYQTQVEYKVDTYHSSSQTGDDWDFAWRSSPSIWAPAGTVSAGWTDWTGGNSSVFNGGSTTQFIKQTKNTRTVSAGSYTTTTRKVYLRKVIDGEIFAVEDWDISSDISSLGVSVSDQFIFLSCNDISLGSIEDTFNETETKFGFIKAASLGGSGTHFVTNFDIKPNIAI